MTEDTTVTYHYCQEHKHNTTKVEICEEDNKYIVILKKRDSNAREKPTLNLLNNMSQNQENDSSWAFDNIRIIVSKKKNSKKKKIKKSKHRTHFITIDEYLRIMAKKCSTPSVHIDIRNGKSRAKRQRSDTYLNTNTSFRTQCIINTVSLHPKKVPAECLPLLRNPLLQAQLRIYRYHFNEKEETYSCSSNSMSNLIRSLYNYHKEKRFDHFDFFHCGHLQLEEHIFREVREMPERVVRETKDSLHINTLSAGKVFEEREEEMGLTDLSSPLPDEATLKNVQNLTSTEPPIGNTHNEENKIDRQEIWDTVINNPIKIRSEILHTSKANRFFISFSENSFTEKKNLQCVYSLNSFIPLFRRHLGKESKIIKVIQKEIELSQEEIMSGNKEKCTKTQIAEEIASIKQITKLENGQIPLASGENEQQSVKVDKITSQANHLRKIGKEVKYKISIRKVSSEIILKRRDADCFICLDKHVLETKENMHRCNTKHSISLQEVKTTSEKRILKRVRKDVILFKELSYTADRKRQNKSPVFDDTIRPNKLLAEKVDDQTSPVVADSSFSNRKNIVKQLDDATVENKCITEKPLKDSSVHSIISVKKNTELNMRPKEKHCRRRGIPVPVATRKRPRKITVPSPLPKTKAVKLVHFKTPTLTTSLHKLTALAANDELDNKEIDNAKTEGSTSARKNDMEQLNNAKSPFDDACDCSFCSVYTSQVKQISRNKTKSLLEKNKISKAQGTHTVIESTIKDDTHKPSPDNKISWDKVLTMKINNELSVIKNPDPKLSKVRPATAKIERQREVMHGFSLLDGNAASKVKKDPSKCVSEKERYAKAQVLKQFTPLEGKTDPQKEKILRALVGKGKPLPEGRTKAEKALIEKVKAETVLLGHTGYFTALTERKHKIMRR